MISNGFQARLLKDELVSIEETFAITPACSLFEGKDGSAASSPSEVSAEQQKKMAIFPSISVDCYSPALRPKALSVVRRGAVFVTPRSSVSESNATLRPIVADESSPTIAEGSVTEQASKLFLAFRWVGAEHNNAQSANVLGDIGKANLQRLKGVGLVEPTLDVVPEEGEGEEEDVAELDPTPLTPLRDSTSKACEVKDIKRKFFPYLSSRNKKKVAKQDQKVSTPAAEKDYQVTTPLEHPILAQVYFDNQLLPLVPAESEIVSSTSDKLLSTVQLRGGALLDLKDIGSAMPNAAINEILHTVTLHLWDATRKDIDVGDSFKPGQQIEWSPKKTVVPNVIFHFEVVSSGPSVIDEVATPFDQASSTPIDSPSANVASSSSETVIPSYPNTSSGRLASVVEEDTLRSMDEAILTGTSGNISRHTKMRKAASLAANALKPKQRTAVQASFEDEKDKGKGREIPESQAAEPVVEESSEEDEAESEEVDATADNAEEKTDDAANTSVMKTLVRKVKFKRSNPSSGTIDKKEEQADSSEGMKAALLSMLLPKGSKSSKKESTSIPEVMTIKVDAPQSCDTPLDHRSILGPFTAPLRRASSTGSNRFGKMLGRRAIEAKRASLLGSDSAQHKEICQAINKVEVLKREHVLVENERKLLEEQWSKALLKSLDEDVTMLEKRVEEGKREIDVLRKRVWPSMN